MRTDPSGGFGHTVARSDLVPTGLIQRATYWRWGRVGRSGKPVEFEVDCYVWAINSGLSFLSMAERTERAKPIGTLNGEGP